LGCGKQGSGNAPAKPKPDAEDQGMNQPQGQLIAWGKKANDWMQQQVVGGQVKGGSAAKISPTGLVATLRAQASSPQRFNAAP
jgi:hypothetical protein